LTPAAILASCSTSPSRHGRLGKTLPLCCLTGIVAKTSAPMVWAWSPLPLRLRAGCGPARPTCSTIPWLKDESLDSPLQTKQVGNLGPSTASGMSSPHACLPSR
jgi:hypothetical protein